MLEHSLNIVGTEWIVIIFVALILILGTNKLPDAAKKLGKAVNEYNKAKNDMTNQMKDYSNTSMQMPGPVESERAKLELMAKTLGIDSKEKTDEELRKIISSKIGQKNQD